MPEEHKALEGTTPVEPLNVVGLNDLLERTKGVCNDLRTAHQAMPEPRDSYANMPAFYVARAEEALTNAVGFLKKANDLNTSKPVQPCQSAAHE